MSLLDRTRAVLPSWLAIYYEDPIEIDRGEGRQVWDAHGNVYLDFFGGILTTMTAHALPEVTKAVAEQAGGSSTAPRSTSTGRWWSWPSRSPRSRRSPTPRSS